MADIDFLKNVGRSRSQLKSEATSLLDRILGEWVKERIAVGQKELEDDDRNGTSALSTSLRPEIISSESDALVNVMAEDYWDYINSGVNGVQNKFGAKYSFQSLGVGTAMKNSFKEFIQVRGIQPREATMNYDELAYVLAKATKRDGIRATNFMDEAFNDASIKDLAKRIGKDFVKLIIE